MIVRDEEATLPRCLESLAGAVDEIVVVDTGSTDGTLEAARRYTAQVYPFEWIQDFAAARQFAFDQARGDWVFWLDADDILRGAENIRRLAKEAPAGVGAVHWPYVVAWDAWGNPTCRFWRERLVRNDDSYRWSGRVHEVLTTNRPWKAVYNDQVIVEHHPPAREAEHTRRNLEILEAEYAASQGNPPARLLFYLGREYAAAGQQEQALEILEEHQRRCTWGDERYQSLLQTAAILLGQGRDEQAIDALLQALKVCPHWPDAYFALARVYYQRCDWHKVLHWTEMGRAMPQPETSLFTNPMDYRFNWMIYYTNALYHLGETQAALDWSRKALQICPGDAMHRQNLAFFKGSLTG
jgi:tetratricopeptide (TPR) repeat protein